MNHRNNNAIMTSYVSSSFASLNDRELGAIFKFISDNYDFDNIYEIYERTKDNPIMRDKLIKLNPNFKTDIFFVTIKDVKVEMTLTEEEIFAYRDGKLTYDQIVAKATEKFKAKEEELKGLQIHESSC